MTTASSGSAQRVALVVHAALVAGVVFVVAVFTFLRTTAPATVTVDLTWPLRGAGALVLVGMAVLTVAMRRALPVPRAGARLDAWWGDNLPRAVVLWAAAEGAATAGAVFWYLTGDAVTLTVMTGVALIVLVVQRPGALAGR